MENFTESRAYGLSKTELIYSITADDGVQSAAAFSQRVTYHGRSLPCAACTCDAQHVQASRRAIAQRIAQQINNRGEAIVIARQSGLVDDK